MDKVKNKNVVNNISMQIKDFSNESSFRAKIKERNIEPATLKNICNLKDIKSCLFEWTDFKSKVKPYYDIDLKLNFKPVDKYIDTKKKYYLDILQKLYPEGNIAISHSHGDKEGKYAVSFHYVINNYECTIPELKDFNKDNQLYKIEGIDKAVYRDGGNMRCINSYKPNDNRQKKMNNVDDDIYDYFIQSNEITNSKQLPIQKKEPVITPPDSPKAVKEKVEVEEEDDDFDFEVIEQPINKLPTFEEVKNTLMKIEDRVYEYNEWLEVGLAFHNICSKLNKVNKGLHIFQFWSSKCDKHKEEDIKYHWNYWTKNNFEGEKLGYGSLVMWANECEMDRLNPFKKIYFKNLKKVNGEWIGKPNMEGMLYQLNRELIFCKETGDYIILCKNEKNEESWFLKGASKIRDHFSKYKFLNEKFDKTIEPYMKWKDWDKRKEVMKIGFDPSEKPNKDIFNLWNGFAISKEEADKWEDELADPILHHIKYCWCNGNEKSYNYIMNYLSHIIQKPHIKTAVLLALKSKQGGGKGVIINLLQEIIGERHFAVCSNTEHLYGNFNGQLEGKVLINLDEALWGGDKKNEGIIKNKITEKSQYINKKNKEGYMVDDYANYIITTNNDWFAGCTEDDRRHYCLALNNQFAGRSTAEKDAYFKKIYQAPAEAFAKILYNRDISEFNPRIFEKTDLLQEQVERNWNSVKEWFHSVMMQGGFNIDTCSCDWGDLTYVGKDGDYVDIGKKVKGKKSGELITIRKDCFYKFYESWKCDKRKFSDNTFFRDIRQNCLDDLYREIRPLVKGGGTRPTYIVLPPLEECRAKWNDKQEYVYDYGLDEEFEEMEEECMLSNSDDDD